MKKNIGIGELEQKIDSIFNMAITCQDTAESLRARIQKEINEPLAGRYKNGNRHYSVWLCGYASGYIQARRNDLLNNKVGFCYEIEGILYSTHRQTDKRQTEEFYAAGRGQELSNYQSNFYWKNSTKPYTTE